MSNKNTVDKQPRVSNANERKFLKITNSRWLTWAFAVFWVCVAFSDYRRHQLSWLDGFVAGSWSVLAVVELIGVDRWKHRRKTMP